MPDEDNLKRNIAAIVTLFGVGAFVAPSLGLATGSVLTGAWAGMASVLTGVPTEILSPFVNGVPSWFVPVFADGVELGFQLAASLGLPPEVAGFLAPFLGFALVSLRRGS